MTITEAHPLQSHSRYVAAHKVTGSERSGYRMRGLKGLHQTQLRQSAQPENHRRNRRYRMRRTKECVRSLPHADRGRVEVTSRCQDALTTQEQAN